MLQQYVNRLEAALESRQMQGAELLFNRLGVDPVLQNVLVFILLIACVLNEQLDLLRPHLQRSVMQEREASFVSDLGEPYLQVLQADDELS